MMQRRNLGSFCGSALTIAFVLGWSALGSAASTIVSARNSSDPRARVFDGKLYLYTSSDMNQSGNWPMNKTYCYSLTKSSDDPGLAASWTDNDAVLSESAYAWSRMENHLWAPDAFEGKDGKYYLYVPDTYDSAGGSRVGVSVSSSPTGPFAPPSGLTSSNNYVQSVTPYMSDPSVFADPNDSNGQRYLVYADGDYNSTSFGCGHLSIAKLDPSTTTITGNQKIQWTNQSSMPSAGGCTPAYIEGAELGYFGGVGKDGNGKYFLYFAIKDNTSYTESIAYGTADSVMGPYTYQGMIMSGQSGSGWTNQASIVEWQGHYLFFYHNDPKNGTNPNRQVFLECVGIQNGKISPVTRGSYKSLSDCPAASTDETGGAGGTSSGGSGSVGGQTSTGGSGGVGGKASTGGVGVGGKASTGGSGGAAVTRTNVGGSGIGNVGGKSSTGGVGVGGSSSATTVFANGGVTMGTTSVTGVGGATAISTVGAFAGSSTAVTASGGASSTTDSYATGTSSTDSSSDSGCSCRVTSKTNNPGSTKTFGILVLGILAFARRRRR